MKKEKKFLNEFLGGMSVGEAALALIIFVWTMAGIASTVITQLAVISITQWRGIFLWWALVGLLIAILGNVILCIEDHMRKDKNKKKGVPDWTEY